jgi:sarcosine oxidase subunit beta
VRTENLVIGGGVYGAAVAWELLSRGAGCHLLEAKTIASGASGGPGRRGVRANGRDPRELPLIRMAREFWPSLHETLGVDALFEQTGHLILIERDEDVAAAEVRARMQDALGLASDMLSASQLRDYEPGVGDDVQAALFCPGDGVADHSATTRAYAAAARAAGAIIREGVEATRLVLAGERISAVETSGGSRIEVDGNILVLANNAVPDLLDAFIDLPVWPLPYQVLVSKPLAHVPVRHLVGHAHRKLSLKAEAGSRLMISGGRLGRWDEDEDRGLTVEPEVVANVADAEAVYPALHGLEVEIADAGHLEAQSIDGVPIIDRVPGTGNAYYATGWCGHGWAIAPAVAKLLASWALDGRRPPILAPFSHDRFR